ncbi:MAG: Fic family protein [Clostridia bacterium]|nr:Fic family protein [Clostridia bacterium]
MNYEEKRSKYYYDDQDILINKMDIKDIDLLNEFERRVVSLKLLIIDHTEFRPRFDKYRLKEIHSFLFSEIYDFAGEYREENLAKDDFRFASCEFIDSELDRILDPVCDLEDLKGLSDDELAERVADIMAELNVVHPFREGNGRTYREFMRQMCDKLGYSLDWSKVSYEELFESSLKSVVDISDLTEVIKKCLSKKEE